MRFRHFISGSEAGQPRPMAYMRRGRTQRSRSGRAPRRATLVRAGVLLVLIVLALLALYRGLTG